MLSEIGQPFSAVLHPYCDLFSEDHHGVFAVQKTSCTQSVHDWVNSRGSQLNTWMPTDSWSLFLRSLIDEWEAPFITAHKASFLTKPRFWLKLGEWLHLCGPASAHCGHQDGVGIKILNVDRPLHEQQLCHQERGKCLPFHKSVIIRGSLQLDIITNSNAIKLLIFLDFPYKMLEMVNVLVSRSSAPVQKS